MECWWFPGGSPTQSDVDMTSRKITKRVVDQLATTGVEYFFWDGQLSGFGVRVRATGSKSYVVRYRAGVGRKAPSRRMTLAPVGKITADEARAMARRIIGDVAHGDDPASERSGSAGRLRPAKLQHAMSPNMCEHTTSLLGRMRSNCC
jgi:hypothetical protein